MYPSGSLTPSANPAIKAHKPAKDFPARLITGHIDAPQEALSSLLNKILQPFVEKSKHVCKNSFQFVEAIKNLKLGPLDKMVSFDAAVLFPSMTASNTSTISSPKTQPSNNARNSHLQTSQTSSASASPRQTLSTTTATTPPRTAVLLA